MAAHFTPPSSVRLMRTGDGAVLLSLDSNAYYGLNPTGVAIWEGLVEEGLAPEGVVRSLCRDYRVSEEVAREAVAELVTELRGEGLLKSGRHQLRTTSTTTS